MRALVMVTMATAMAACSYAPSRTAPVTDDGAPIDNAVAPDQAPGCFGTGLGLAVCPSVPPTTEVDRDTDAMLDTGSSVDCDPGIAELCVIAGTRVRIRSSATIAVVGSRPLVLFSTDEIEIEGTIDVSSRIGQKLGPAADAAACDAPSLATMGGGGAGGGFGTKGGDGGRITGGIATAAQVATTLRGGCAGGIGATGGEGGHGGGVVALIANGSIRITGRINASGASGGGTETDNGGGGGGGSGGMIVLDTPVLDLDAGAQVFANGGAGGEGAGGNTSNPGTDSTGPTTAAVGGLGGSSGGDGGNGATGTATGMIGASPGGGEGGGGGGGGVGVIRVFRAAPVNGSSPPMF